MALQVIWTKQTLEYFIEEANLSGLEADIMRSRAAGETRTWQMMHYNLSMSTLDRIIKRLKIKYDETQRQHPDKLPVRKNSAQELYMDTH